MNNKYSLFIEINLILIVFAAIFFQGASAEIDWQPIGLWIFAVLCLSFYWWGKGYINGPRLTGLEPFLFPWLLVLVLSGINSSHQLPGILFFERLITSLIFFWLMAWHFQARQKEKYLLWSLFAFPVLLSISGIASFVTQTPLFFPFSENKRLVSATIFNPNNFAGLINLCLFLGFGLVMSLRMPRKGVLGEAASRTAVFSFTILVLLIALGLSLSRAGWISFYISGISLLFWLGIHSNNRRTKSLLTVVFMIVALGTTLTLFIDKVPVLRELQSLKHYFVEPPDQITMDSRVQFWKSTLAMFYDHLWLGIGPGAYWIEYASYRQPLAVFSVRHAHNDFLELVSETGVFSAALFMVILVQAFRIWMQRYRKDMDHFERRVSIGIVFGIFAFLLQDLVDFHFHIPGLVYYLLALSAFLVKPKSTEGEIKPVKGLGKVMLFIILPFALVLGSMQWVSAFQFWQGVKFFKNQQWLHARDAFQSSSRIIRINPEPFFWMAKSNLRLLPDSNAEMQISLLKQSERELAKAISIENKDPYYWSLLGSVSEILKEYGKKPIKSPDLCYRQALAIDPNHPLFLELYAKYLIRNNQKDKAGVLISKLAGIEPAYAVAVGQVWLKKDYSPEELVKLFNNNVRALTLLAGKLKSSDKYKDQALIAAQKAFEADPQNPNAAYLLSQMAVALKDCEIITKLAVNPRLAEPANRIYAACLAKTNQFDQAIEEYLKLSQTNPTKVEYRLELSRIYLRKNDPERAREQLAWIADRPENVATTVLAEAYLNLARIFEKQEQVNQALKYYRLYLEQKPEDQTVRNKVDKLENRGQVDMIHSPWEIKKDSK